MYYPATELHIHTDAIQKHAPQETSTMHACHIIICMILSTPQLTASPTITATGTVVQFVVYAEEQADVTRVFPGAYVDFTWNNLYVVSIWTNDAATLIPDIQRALQAHETELQVVIPPYAMAAATQKWLEYNLIWVCMLTLIFIAGCACGAVMLNKCITIKRHHQQHFRPCRTRC
jgi:hypothetical protein